ncbi:formate/nitrite transporter family protein [Paenibacillus xerothermodurans]|uniref:Formate/nitrite transporter family protein n=1 Tax=Paenibacillus xerothermodurans TaxID=1977292 RepID=A0A2W1N6A9_PAEXE|nr:formate/nitrite transporter family protein [Paenibacillus xerothermodurans]PZE20189.1 formate/nitrite transporter family protein [Paenibacillus xerothermodurans]
MGYNTPQRVAELSVEAGVRKVSLPLPTMLALGFLAGAFISLGYLLDIRVSGNLPHEWGSFAGFLGAAVFPLGLILTIVAGGELLTGNMMLVAMATLAGKVTTGQLVRNWVWIGLSNFVGAVFVAYFFGYVVGLTAEGPYLAKTVAFSNAKLDDTFGQAFVSGIGCNWLVGLAVWLAYCADDVAGKIWAIWWPIMGFVATGFQHVVANMFVIPAAIFVGEASWWDWFMNFIPVLLGNAVGGTVFVSVFYWISYIKGRTI